MIRFVTNEEPSPELLCSCPAKTCAVIYLAKSSQNGSVAYTKLGIFKEKMSNYCTTISVW